MFDSKRRQEMEEWMEREGVNKASLPKKSFEVKVKRPSSACPKTLRINLENCKYDVVRETAERLNYKARNFYALYAALNGVPHAGGTQRDRGVGPLLDRPVSVIRACIKDAALPVHQPLPWHDRDMPQGTTCQTPEALTGVRTHNPRAAAPEDYNFFPPSWSVPGEVDEWRREVRRRAASGQVCAVDRTRCQRT
eukprot:8143184-Pyramimonas_sp.AAC.1